MSSEGTNWVIEEGIERVIIYRGLGCGKEMEKIIMHPLHNILQ